MVLLRHREPKQMHFIVPNPSVAFQDPLEQHPEGNADPRGSLTTETLAPIEMTRRCSLRERPALVAGFEKLYGVYLR